MNTGVLMNCGLCCFIISIWGALQLIIMAICYNAEVVTLIEDCIEEEYDDYEDFIKKTKHNYAAVARNCLIAAIIYIILAGVSYACIRKARRQMEIEALKYNDEKYFCSPKPPAPVDSVNIK